MALMASTATSSDRQIPSSYSRIIARMLALQERELPRLLRGTTLTTNIFLPGDESLITGEEQLQILNNGHRLMAGDGFGLAMGRELGPASHGPVGYLSLSSPDLMSALEAYADFIPARLPIIDIRVQLNGPWVDCTYRVLLKTSDRIFRGLAESFAVAMQAIVEELIGREAREATACFSYDAPAYAALYRKTIHGTTEFGAPGVCYRIPAELTLVPNSRGDSEAFRVTRDLCAALLQRQPSIAVTTADRVRTLLLTKPQVAVTEADIARAMFISRRTLARRLQQEGTGYRNIRDEVLRDLACRFLRDTGRSVDSVSATLGYHDSAAFRKAFKRWTNSTPSAYRATLRA